MHERRPRKEQIPEAFPSMEAAVDFWDSHDLAEFWPLTEAVDFNVDPKQSAYLVALDAVLTEELAAEARRKGLSTEALINLWLKDKLRDTVV